MNSIPPLKPRQRVMGQDRIALRDDLLQRYQHQSIRSIMRQTGRSYGFVHRILTEAGATLRPRGGGHRKAQRQHQ